MKKLVLLMILFAAVLFTAGCTENISGNNTSSDIAKGKSTVVKITQLEQINTSLMNGPVFLKMGSRWCPACRSMKPILENLTAEYGGNATIASIDVDQNPELAKYFRVEIIPDSCVIVGVGNGTYIYMQENGNVSTDRSKARMVGINNTGDNNYSDEKVFEKVMDHALLWQRRDKSE
jgi:thioredoxin 1